MISAPTILSQETAISCQVMNNVIEIRNCCVVFSFRVVWLKELLEAQFLKFDPFFIFGMILIKIWSLFYCKSDQFFLRDDVNT